MAHQTLAHRRPLSTGHRRSREPRRGTTSTGVAPPQPAFDGVELLALPEIGRPPGVGLSRTAILQLQRCHGNHFVQRLIAGPPLVQRCGGVVHNGCACAANGGHAPEDEEQATTQQAALIDTASRLQRLTEAEKAEDLKSSRFAGNPRLESAFDNTPPMKPGEKGEAVKAIQQGLIDDGFPMPISTKKTGAPDGDYGGETVKTVKGFQKKHGLLDSGIADGVVGRRTLGKLDELAAGGPADKRVGPQTSDFEIKGKSRFADAKSVVFFEKDAAGFADKDEQAKIDAFLKPKDQDLKLTGVASEDENPALAAARVGTVSKALTDGGHDAVHVIPAPDPAAGKGDRDYRNARRVEITTGAAQPKGPKCENADGTKVPPQGPCDTETAAKLTAAQTQADTLLTAAIDALSAAPMTAETLAALDVTFGGNVAGAGKKSAPVVKVQLTRLRSHVKNLSKPKAHDCGNLCDASCSSGSGAYNQGVGGAAKMTLCPGFKDATGNLPAAILIHEGAHGTAGLETQDFAYAAERAIDFLSPAQAVRNSDSYVNFCLRISTGATIDKPPTDKLVGMDASPSDQDAARRSLARVEKLVQFASQDIASLYDALKVAQEKGSWFHPKVPGFGPPLMNKVAPRFALTPTVKPPTNRDRFAMAAISDRYQQMIGSVYGVQQTLTRDPKGPTAWEAGPGTNVALGPEFFAAAPNARVDILLAALATATPGISPGMVPEYVALAHDIENLFHR